jgi:hypothetical protein
VPVGTAPDANAGRKIEEKKYRHGFDFSTLQTMNYLSIENLSHEKSINPELPVGLIPHQLSFFG